MAKRTRPETVDYVAKIVKSKPDVAYDDVVKQGKKDGYHVYPLIMGLAKNKLGMGRPKAKRGPGRPRGSRGPGRPAGARGPGRPAMNGRGVTGDLVRGIARMQDDVATMRGALREIAKLASRF